jgi:hypothetical protein
MRLEVRPVRKDRAHDAQVGGHAVEVASPIVERQNIGITRGDVLFPGEHVGQNVGGKSAKVIGASEVLRTNHGQVGESRGAVEVVEASLHHVTGGDLR